MAVTADAAVTQGERRGRGRQMAATLAALIAALALSLSFFNAWLPAPLLPGGPLAGGASGLTGPLQPRDTGFVYGLILTNPGRSDAVIDSVTFDGDATLHTSGRPYVWDVTGRAMPNAWSTPLPAKYANLVRHPVTGYLVRHELRGVQAKGTESPEAEIVLDFGVPARTANLSSMTIHYHIGLKSYRKTFDAGFTVCPQNDLHPCGW